jgi:hypothetical protein
MKALVVYESLFGNTEQVARTVAAGLGESREVQLVEVSQAPNQPDSEVALIVAGGPTHAFSMSRKNTRADALNRGAHEGGREFGLREWLAALPAGRHSTKIATFDTKIESMRFAPGSAAKGAPKTARRRGYEPVAQRRASMSAISAVPCSTARSTGRGHGPGNSVPLCRRLPHERAGQESQGTSRPRESEES